MFTSNSLIPIHLSTLSPSKIYFSSNNFLFIDFFTFLRDFGERGIWGYGGYGCYRAIPKIAWFPKKGVCGGYPWSVWFAFFALKGFLANLMSMLVWAISKRERSSTEGYPFVPSVSRLWYILNDFSLFPVQSPKNLRLSAGKFIWNLWCVNCHLQNYPYGIIFKAYVQGFAQAKRNRIETCKFFYYLKNPLLREQRKLQTWGFWTQTWKR